MTEEELGIKDLLKEVLDKQKELVGDKQQEKTWKFWKLPRKARVSKVKTSKGWAGFILIKDTGAIDFAKAQVHDGIAIIDGFPRIASINHALTYKNQKVYIIPSWSMKPISMADNLAQSEQEKMNMSGRRAVLAALQTEKIKQKKDFGSLGWIILIAAIVGVVWYFGKQYGWF